MIPSSGQVFRFQMFAPTTTRGNGLVPPVSANMATRIHRHIECACKAIDTVCIRPCLATFLQACCGQALPPTFRITQLRTSCIRRVEPLWVHGHGWETGSFFLGRVSSSFQPRPWVRRLSEAPRQRSRPLPPPARPGRAGSGSR